MQDIAEDVKINSQAMFSNEFLHMDISVLAHQ